MCAWLCQLSVGSKNPDLVRNAEMVTLGVRKWPGNLALNSDEQYKGTGFWLWSQSHAVSILYHIGGIQFVFQFGVSPAGRCLHICVMSLQGTSKLAVVLVACHVSNRSRVLVTLNDEWQRQCHSNITCFDIWRSKIQYSNYLEFTRVSTSLSHLPWSELDSESFLRGEITPLHVKPHSKNDVLSTWTDVCGQPGYSWSNGSSQQLPLTWICDPVSTWCPQGSRGFHRV